MSLPIGYVLVLMSLGMAIFVLFFIRKYSDFLSSGTFCKLLAAFLALFFFTCVLAWFKVRPPKDKVRVAFFPFWENSVLQDSGWLGWGIASSSARLLDKSTNGEILVYPLDWLWEAISEDSITSKDYVLKYADRVKLDYLILGDIDSRCAAWPIQWSVYDVNSATEILTDKAQFHDLRIQKPVREIVNSVLSLLNFKNPKSFFEFDTLQSSKLKWKYLAEKAVARKDYKQCVEFAEKVFAVDSTYSPIRNLLAWAQLKVGLELKSKGKPAGNQYAIVQRICKNTIKRDSLNSVAYRILGEYYIIKELWSKSEYNLRKALRLDADDARIYRDFAQLHPTRYKDLGFHSEKDILNYAIFLNPCYEEVRIQLAQYYYFKRWPSKAEKEIKNLLAVHPNSIDGLLYLIKIYGSQNKILELSKVGKRAVELAPDNADVYFNLGVSYYNWEDYDNAQAFFQRAVDLKDHLNSHLYLAYLYNRKGDRKNAIKHLRRRLHLRRDDIYANLARDLLYQLTHQDSVDTTDEKPFSLPATPDDRGTKVRVSEK